MKERIAASAPQNVTGASCNRERVLQRIQIIEKSCARDPARRRVELNKLRRQFITDAVADRLAKEGSDTRSRDELYRQAAAIMAKAEFRQEVAASPLSRRSREEERYMVSARVAWHKIIKSQGVKAANPYSAKSTSLTGAPSTLRKLKSLRADPDLGSTIVHAYIASLARHLQEVCEDAARLNPRFVSQQVWPCLRELERLGDVPSRDER